MVKKPIITDPSHPGAPRTSAAQHYKEGVASRAAAQRAQKPPVPDLTSADSLYKAGRDKPMTLAQIGAAQTAASDTPSGKQVFRPETLAGLAAIHNVAQEQRSHMSDPQQYPAPPMPPSPTPVAAAVVKPEVKPEAKIGEAVIDKNERMKETLAEMDSLEFDRILRSVQHDAINNEKERAAVKERVKPIDLIAGISTGVFIQDVPIIPGSLTVRYRTITSLENQAIRLLLFKMVDENKLRENISAELYGLMQTCCSVISINSVATPEHLKGVGYQSEFDEDGFQLKFAQFIRYPLVMLHAIGTHGYWFEQRVRDAFTTDSVKNG